jgi:hypothetical protein
MIGGKTLANSVDRRFDDFKLALIRVFTLSIMICAFRQHATILPGPDKSYTVILDLRDSHMPRSPFIRSWGCILLARLVGELAYSPRLAPSS